MAHLNPQPSERTLLYNDNDEHNDMTPPNNNDNDEYADNNGNGDNGRD